MKKITGVLFAFACVLILYFSACKKETSSGTSAMSVRLKDAPGHWDRCMVELRGLRVYSEKRGWITIPINDTVVDILKLQDTTLLLTTINIDAGTISQVDLTIGTRDSITIDGATFVVAPSSRDSNDIVIHVSDTLLPGGSFTMVLDLNASGCVHDDGGGRYSFHGMLGHWFGREGDWHGH